MAALFREDAPAGDEEVPAALMLPGTLDRVVSGPTWPGGIVEPRAVVVNDALAGSRKLSPTRVFEVRDALLSHGSVYARGHRYILRHEPLHRSFLGPDETIDEAVLVGTPWGASFFGHWVMEDCAQHVLAESLSGLAVDLTRKPYAHEREYRALFGLQEPRRVTHAFVRKLTVIEDHGCTLGKRTRIALIRHRLRSALGSLPARKPGVWVSRGSTGARRNLQNEGEVLQRLRRRGFTVVEPEKLSAREVAGQLAAARVVVGIDGSHMAPNVVATQSGSVVLELHPSNRFYPALRVYLHTFGIGHALLVCDQRGPSDFVCDLGELERMLDLCLAAVPA
jgi:hypothetical protein